MSLTAPEEAVLSSIEARISAEAPDLLELACFFDLVSGRAGMPRQEQRTCRAQCRAGLVRAGARVLARIRTLILLVLAAIWRVICQFGRGIANAEAWYSAALITGQTPVLADAEAGNTPGRSGTPPDAAPGRKRG